MPCDRNFTQFQPANHLEKEDEIELDSEITLVECKEAVDELPINKTPGTDGLSSEFYKHFWTNICDHLYKCIKMSVGLGELSMEQRRSIITLIPKNGKDLKHVKNWRPISILNVDYKIIAKILATRLKHILPKLINSDQLAYVQGR